MESPSAIAKRETGHKTYHRPALRETVAVCFLALVSIGCSAVAVSGLESGWAKVSEKGLTTDSSAFTNLLQYLFEEKGNGFHMDRSILLLFDHRLPRPPVDVSLRFGLRRFRTSAVVHAGGEVPPELRSLALAISPREDLDAHIVNIVDDRRDTLVLPYEGDRKGGKWIGIITMGALALSCLLFTIVIIPGHFLRTLRSWILRKGHFIGVFLLVVYCVELVCLIIGVRKDLEENPVVQHAYTPLPDWAWIAAVISAACWIPASFLSKGKGVSEEETPKKLIQGLPSNTGSVRKTLSWVISTKITNASPDEV